MDDEDAYSLIQAFLLWFFDRQHEQHRQQQQQLQLIQQQQEWLANQNQLLRSQLLSQHYLLVEQINSLSAPSRQVSFQGTGPVTNANTNSSLADEEYAVEEETISGQAPAESAPKKKELLVYMLNHQRMQHSTSKDYHSILPTWAKKQIGLTSDFNVFPLSEGTS